MPQKVWKERQPTSRVFVLVAGSLGSFFCGFSWLDLPSGLSLHFSSSEALWVLVHLCQVAPSWLWLGGTLVVTFSGLQLWLFVPHGAAVAALATSIISLPPDCCAATAKHDWRFSLNSFLIKEQYSNTLPGRICGCDNLRAAVRELKYFIVYSWSSNATASTSTDTGQFYLQIQVIFI